MTRRSYPSVCFCSCLVVWLVFLVSWICIQVEATNNGKYVGHVIEKINVYIPRGLCHSTIRDGIVHSTNFEEVANVTVADVVIADIDLLGCEGLENVYAEYIDGRRSGAVPFVVLDWRTDTDLTCGPLEKIRWYFKVSVVDKKWDSERGESVYTSVSYSRPVIQLESALLLSHVTAVESQIVTSYPSRAFDVCFFAPISNSSSSSSSSSKSSNVPRVDSLAERVSMAVASMITNSNNVLSKEKVFIGSVNGGMKYAKTIAQCKLIVVTNPPEVETHVPLLEAMASGALVLVDRMYHMPRGVEDNVNVVVYSNTAELVRRIEYYMQRNGTDDTSSRMSEAEIIGRAAAFEAQFNHQSPEVLKQILLSVLQLSVSGDIGNSFASVISLATSPSAAPTTTTATTASATTTDSNTINSVTTKWPPVPVPLLGTPSSASSVQLDASSAVFTPYTSRSVFGSTSTGNKRSTCDNTLDYSLSLDKVVASLERRRDDSIIQQYARDVYGATGDATADGMLRKGQENSSFSFLIEGINYASGTTGTRMFEEVFKTLKLKESHYHVRWQSLLDQMRKCISDSTANSSPACVSSVITNQTIFNVFEDLRSFEIVSDTPYGAIFAELIFVFPWLSSIVSCREMNSFLHTRFGPTIYKDLICLPDVWLGNQDKLLHPFDILGCLRLKDTVGDALTTTQTLRTFTNIKGGVDGTDGWDVTEYVRNAYVQMNSINYLASVAVTGVEKVIPICITDYDREDGTKLVTDMLQHKFSEHIMPSAYWRLTGGAKRGTSSSPPVPISASRTTASTLTTNTTLPLNSAAMSRNTTYRYSVTQLRTFKVYIPLGRCQPIICDAVGGGFFDSSLLIEKVSNISQADVVLVGLHRMDCSSFGETYEDYMKNRKSTRTLFIVLDWQDPQELKCGPLRNVRWFFKRSLVDKYWNSAVGSSHLQAHEYPRPDIHHMDYALKQAFVDSMQEELAKQAPRDFDVCCFFEDKFGALKQYEHSAVVVPSRNGGMREIITFILRNMTINDERYNKDDEKNKFFVGIAGAHNEEGRQHVQSPYVERLAQCKIVVTANPANWEGDFRLLESLSSGALVLVDEMMFPPPGLKDRSNLVVYNTSNLADLVDYYLKRPLERAKIARAGYMEALGNHQSYHLIERMLLQVFKSQSESE